MYTKEKLKLILLALVGLLNERKVTRDFYNAEIDDFKKFHEDCNCDEYKFLLESYDRACQEVKDVEETYEITLEVLKKS